MMTTKGKGKRKRDKGRVNNGFSVPQEIISEILKQLPVKTLLRFRCVSKLWRSIIDDPFFVESHDNRSITRPGGINLLFLKLPKSGENRQLYCADPEGGSALHLGSLPHMVEVSPFPLSLYSVKGLVCFQRWILNPSTREIKQLPPIRIRTSTIDIAAGNNSLTVISSNFLGFDPADSSCTTGKHKVLNITEISNSEELDVAETQFKVLTLSRGGDGSGSAWRDIDHHTSDSSLNSQLDKFSADCKRTCCINDIIYCLGWWASEGVILAFEVGPESFKIMPLPQGAVRESLYAIQVRERLALISCNFTEIWILEDYDKQLWNKQTLNIPHSLLLDANKLIRPICSIGGEILFEYDKSKCFYYDQETETVRFYFNSRFVVLVVRFYLNMTNQETETVRKVRKISKLVSKLLSSFSFYFDGQVESLSSSSVIFTNYVESLYRIKDM